VTACGQSGASGLEGRLHKEIGGQRVESLRWSFLFWIGLSCF
jgi:hypothetical protein